MIKTFRVGVLVAIAIISAGLVSCSSGSSRNADRLHNLRTEGLPRLMVEECGLFEIRDNGVAVDTSVGRINRLNFRNVVYQLNADSTRYLLVR